MTLRNNPFYILRVSCSAGRREIVLASDELSFLLDSEICSKAQNELINVNKRLSAEINWFIDVDANTIDQIRSNIDNSEPISTDGLISLSRLNATLYNFSLIEFEDDFELGYSILEIDEQYTNLDVSEIVELINNNRDMAKLALVKAQDVITELGKKREEIRQMITEKLSSLDQDTYVQLVTVIAEKCIADDLYTDGVILSDVIDQYEVRIQSVLEKSTEDIENHIERIKNWKDNASVSADIELLISRVRKWDVLAQPLQLKSQANGIPHEISERLGSSLRNLALFLHNEKGVTKEALNLVNAMKSVFAELGELSELFDSDSETLNVLLKEQNEVEVFEKEGLIEELNSFMKESKDVLSFSNSTRVNCYVESVKKLNRRLKSLDVDRATKNKIRENICGLARGTAIELHNTKHQTDYALTIVNVLLDEFNDMPLLRNKLNEDSRALMRQSALSDSAVNKSSSSGNKGCVIGVLVFVAIIGVLTFIFSIGKPSSSKNTSTSSSNYNNSEAYSKSESSNPSSSSKKSESYSTIGLSKSNFERYFNLETDAEFVDDNVTISYSITPKDSFCYNYPESSEKIEVEIGIVVSMFKYNFGDQKYNKKHSVVLEKSKKYTASGKFSFTYSSVSETVYWGAEVTSCSGKIRQ